MLSVQMALNKRPLGFSLIHCPSSIMTFYFRLFGTFVSDSNSVKFYILGVPIQVGFNHVYLTINYRLGLRQAT